MKSNRIVIVFFSLLLTAVSAFADAGNALTAKTFQFKFKDAERAAALIKPLMSGSGSVSIQPSTNTLTVTDSAENLKSIAAALAKFDAPAQAFKLQIRLVSAARVPNAPKVPEELKDVAAKLSGVIGFNSFEQLGSINVETHEGDPVVVDQLAPEYRADLRVGEYDAASDSLRVADFRLQRGPKNGELTQVLKTTLNLRLGQTFIMGASKLPQSNRALMLVIVAKR